MGTNGSTPIVYVNNPPSTFGEHTAAILLNGWAVVNAPRPVPGRVTWSGEFRHGIFYAAGPISEFGSTWRELDAWPVQAITNLEVVERIRRECIERGSELAEILDSFNGDWSELAMACGLPWKVAA